MNNNLKLVSNMDGDDVAEQPLSLVAHHLDLGAMLVGLDVAMIMETIADLKLAIEEPDQEKKQEEGQDGLWDQKVMRPWRKVWAGGDKCRPTITRCGDVQSE